MPDSDRTGEPARTPPPKVSVVITLYNSGSHLDNIVRSLDGQTMPTVDFEVVLVDDGSTDGTLARARELAARRPNYLVKTIPNSGWPGRPRNVGMDASRGDYVFFADHDDQFAPRALAATHAVAVANSSDIVYGKIVRVGKRTSHWSVWWDDLPVADPGGVALTSRTIHKLFRRAFLVEHDIRFLEGRVRVEDHQFMAQALGRAEVVSILASVPTYLWIHRNDGRHISQSREAPDAYWRDYGRVLAAFAAANPPAERLDAARAVIAVQGLTRLSPVAYMRRPEVGRRRRFAGAHKVFLEHLPPHVDERLPVMKRLRAQALRDGDRDRFERLADGRSDLDYELSTESVSAEGPRLSLRLTSACRLAATGEVVVPDEDGPDLLLPAELSAGAPAAARRLLDADRGRLEVTIRHRQLGIEWPVHSQTSRWGPGLRVTTDAEVDLARDTFGGPLAPGRWEVLVRLAFLGDSQIKPVRVPAKTLARIRLPKAVKADHAGRVSFVVPEPAPHPVPRARSVRWSGATLHVELAGNPSGSLVLTPRDDSYAPTSTAVREGAGTVEISAPDSVRFLDLALRHDDGADARIAYDAGPVRCPEKSGAERGFEAYSTRQGLLSLRRTRGRG